MNPISNISKWTSYLTTCVILDFQEHVFRKVRKINLSGAGARNVCFEHLNKDMFLEVQMKHVVNFDVYIVVLLMGPCR